ncbi:general stress protein [Aliidongia sp.]|uniref:general stress protein n=1 Tax=Aliidongia sp. TaxID=1914230 RepID=UPI0039C8AA01
MSKGSGTNRGGSGKFADDPQRASEAGRKGGEHSHGGHSQASSHQPSSPQQGSGKPSGNVADDREKASEAGKKGGCR